MQWGVGGPPPGVGPRREGGDGRAPQLWLGDDGSVYALYPPDQHGPPQRVRVQGGLVALAAGQEQVAIAQFQRQQQQQQQQVQPHHHHHHQDMQYRRQRLYDPRLEEPAANLPVDHREEAIATLLHALQRQGHNVFNDAGPPPRVAELAPAPLALALPVPPPLGLVPRAPPPRRPAASHDSASNSDSQSPPPSTRERSSQPAASAQLSAKEKNRQAQRRFRERQKTRIHALEKDLQTANVRIQQLNVELQAKLAEREREVSSLKEENAMLRGRMEGKQQANGVLFPTEALQSLLQMSAAAAANNGGGGGSGSGGQGAGYRRKRSEDGL